VPKIASVQTPVFIAGASGEIVEPSIPATRGGPNNASLSGLANVIPVDLAGTRRADIVIGVGLAPLIPPTKIPMRVLRSGLGGSFSDVTRQLFGNGKLPSAGAPTQIISLDFDHDGKPDIFVADSGYDGSPADGAVNILLESNPDGSFTDNSAVLPTFTDYTHSAAVGDLNSDGLLDVYVGNISGTFNIGPYILFGRPDGGFDRVMTALPDAIRTLQEKFTASLVMDVDNDGSLDLLLGTHHDNGFVESILLFNDGKGDFKSRPRYTLPFGPMGARVVVLKMNTIDANKDGYTDLLLLGTGSQPTPYVGGSIQLLMNQKNGTFADETVERLGSRATVMTGIGWDQLQVADINGDGQLDILASTQFNSSDAPGDFAWINNGDGTFAALSTATLMPPLVGKIVATDADGDGQLDLVSVQFTGEGSLLYRTYLNKTPRIVPSEPMINDVALNDLLATVMFSPPLGTGGSPVTAYTIISTPGNISATGSSSPITVNGLQEGTSYTFAVRAENASGAGLMSLPSKTIQTPQYAPKVINPPGNQLRLIGAATALKVMVTGAPPFSYQWRLNGKDIPDATFDTLLLPNVQAESVGSYTVVVSNGFGKVESAAGTLRVAVREMTQGFLRREVFRNIPGNAIADLTENSQFPNASAEVDRVSSIESTDLGDFYGERLSGFLSPPADGAFIFFLSADDNAELYLSTDEAPQNKVLLAREPIWNAPRYWVGTARRDPVSPENRSIPVTLRAGNRYYIEVLHKEGIGNGHVEVAWQLPNADAPVNGSAPIGSLFLSYATDFTSDMPPTIVNSPKDTTVIAGEAATLTVTSSGFGPFQYQWKRNGANIQDGTNATLMIPRAISSFAGNYVVEVSNQAGTTLSGPSILTITKAAQTINFAALANQYLGAPPFRLGASVDSGLPVTFEIVSGPAQVSGDSVVLMGLGTVVVRATQSGNDDFKPAASVDRAFTVVDGTPRITKMPLGVVATVGSRVAFSVAATGAPPLRYQWRRNGREILGATDAILELQRVLPEDSGGYSVEVRSVGGLVISAEAPLKLSLWDILFQDTFEISATNATINTEFRDGRQEAGVLGAFSYLVGGEDFATLRVNSTNCLGKLVFPVPHYALASPRHSFTESPQFSVEAELQPNSSPGDSWAGIVIGASRQDASVSNSDGFGILLRGAGGVSMWVGSASAGDTVVPVTRPFRVRLEANTASFGARKPATVAVYINGSLIAVRTNSAGFSRNFITLIGNNNTGALLTHSFDNLRVMAPLGIRATPSILDLSVGETNAQVRVKIPVPLNSLSPAVVTVTSLNPDIATLVGATNGTASLTFQTGGTNSLDVAVVGLSPGLTALHFTTSYGIDVPGDVMVTVNQAPSFKPTIQAQPQSQTALQDSTVAFSITASGTEPLQFQWRRDGIDLPGAKASTLILDHVRVVDAAVYSVVVSNVAGSILSSGAQLVVNVPPTIDQEPSNQTSLAGTEVALSVEAHGTTPLSYQWFRNGTPLAGATNRTLSIPHVLAKDGGNYFVQVSNVAGLVFSKTAGLSVSLIEQVITFDRVEDKEASDEPFRVYASASSSLPVAITVLSGPGRLDGNVVSLAGAGRVILRASQPGDGIFAAAADVDLAILIYPSIRGLRFTTAGGMEFTFLGETGRIYLIETSDDLATWRQVDARENGVGGFLFIEGNQTATKSRYYRVRAQGPSFSE
jgi:hypothetical protein